MVGESYEGWTNAATHRVHLWVMNDYDSYLQYEAEKPFDAEEVKHFVMQRIPRRVFSGIKSDIQGAGQTLKDVNWQELAETWNDE